MAGYSVGPGAIQAGSGVHCPGADRSLRGSCPGSGAAGLPHGAGATAGIGCHGGPGDRGQGLGPDSSAMAGLVVDGQPGGCDGVPSAGAGICHRLLAECGGGSPLSGEAG